MPLKAVGDLLSIPGKKRQSSFNLVSDQREEERSCLFSSVPPTAARERNLN